jgi:hypothetical protein
MSRLLHLYPSAWRERYGDELIVLLKDHPATLSDSFDLIRGALDARLHPQVRGADAPDKEIPVNQRLLGVLAAIGGIAWIIGVASALILPPDEFGDHDNTYAVIGVAIGSSLMGIALGELGTRPGGRSWTGHAIGIAGIALGLTVLMGWPFFILGIVGIPIVMMLGAARAYQTNRLPGWSVAVIAAASALALVGVFGGGGGFVLFGLIGVAGLMIGLLTFRSPALAASAPPAQEPA